MEGRLIPLNNENTAGYTGLCLDVHDLAASKLAAGRDKDLDFVEALLRERYIDRGILLARVEAIAESDSRRASAIARARRLTEER